MSPPRRSCIFPGCHSVQSNGAVSLFKFRTDYNFVKRSKCGAFKITTKVVFLKFFGGLLEHSWPPYRLIDLSIVNNLLFKIKFRLFKFKRHMIHIDIFPTKRCISSLSYMFLVNRMEATWLANQWPLFKAAFKRL